MEQLGSDEVATGIAPEASPRRRERMIAAGLLAALVLAFTTAWILHRRHAGPAVHLSDLQPTTASQDWGQLVRNRSVLGNPAWIGSERFARALGTHANSRICYSLDERYSWFECAVGMDSETIEHGTRIAFKVVGDDRVLHATPVLAGFREPLRIRAGIQGIRELCLVVEDGGDGIDFDHADWGEPRVYE